MQPLEKREYLSAPALDAIPLQTVPAGKTIQVPLTATDADGNPLHYTVSSDDPSVSVSLHPSTNSWLRLSTTQGVMLFQLFNDVAPNTVATMSGLANAGFFDGLKFFGITKSPKFIYSGSPTNDGAGGPGFRFDDEFDPNTVFGNAGVLAMFPSGKDNNGSQFLISDAPERPADFNYTIWGQLVRGQDVLDRFFDVPITNGTVPMTLQKIKSAAIVTDTSDAVLVVKGDDLGSAKVTVTCDDGAGATSSQDFDVSVQADTYNDPPILAPIPDTTGAKNKSLSFPITSFQPGTDAPDYRVNLVDPTDGTLNLDNNVATFTPRKNFTGPVRVFVGVAAEGAVRRGYVLNPYDTQQVQIGIGDLPAIGSALSFDAVAGAPMGKIAVAQFTDTDPNGTLADWNAIASKRDQLGNREGGVNWGDTSIDDGVIVQNRNGSFSVIGSHVYPAPGTYPVTVVVEGNLGARLTLRGTATVRDFGTIQGNTLNINGTSADDIIAVSVKNGQFNVDINGATQKYPADGITRVNIAAFDGNDRVTIGPGVPGTYVDGGAGNDYIDGGDGNDTLTGGAGRNTLNGNGGNDRLNGSGGRDLLNGGEGNDFLYGNGGDDTLDGGSGVDHIFGGDGNDLLIGGGGNDKLYGQAGNDTIIGGKGKDLEDGGDGNDTAQQDGSDLLTSIESVV
jgi:cyclophilin family peptidyl-prolyl cis-trans isomerase